MGDDFGDDFTTELDGPVADWDTTIDLHVDSIPVTGLIRYMCGLASARFAFYGDACVIGLHGAKLPSRVRYYPIAEEVLPVFAERFPEAGSGQDVRSFLHSVGVSSPPTGAAQYLDAPQLLVFDGDHYALSWFLRK